MEEIWKDVVGYEGLYQVSSLGQVASVRGNRRKILRKEIHQRGYERVCLSKACQTKKFRVHRLVAMSFIDNPNGYTQVDHINGNKTMNMVSNLRWVDNSTNSNNRHEATTRKKAVDLLDMDGKVVEHFDSERDAARHLGVNRTTVMAACNGHQRTCAGYNIVHSEK